ncbi:MAG: flagellin [Planctomycetota bacterium]
MTRINTNVGSLVGRNNLQRANASLSQSLTRLSTGLRINTGADDPAGLIASENLRSDITSIQSALNNTDRANQVIATADSALGQVSSLLNDIRGLVTESANAGALSDEQIAANQLQVDSSLEALNRIAQTTTFQGRRLLDGSLDFLTTTTDATDFANVSNLQIDQANLGATGSVAVDIEVTTAATQAQVDIADIPATSTPATATADLDFTLAQSATQSSVTAGGAFAVDVAATQASLSAITLDNGTIAFNATAGGGLDGAAGNIAVVLTDSGAVTTDAATVTFDGTTLTIDVNSDASGTTQLSTIETAVDTFVDGGNGVAAGDITATITGSGDITAADISTNFGTPSLAGGQNAQTDAAATFTANATAGENFDITFATGAGSTIGVTGDATNGYTVTIGATYSGDLDSIATAINAGISEVSNAAFSTNLTFDAAEGDNTGIANVVQLTGGSAAGATGTLALDIATVSNTDTYNDYTFNITEGGGTANTVTATLDTANDEIDINITGTVTGQAIVDAIQAIQVDGSQVFSASLDGTTSTSGFSLSGTSYVEASDSSPAGVQLTGGDGGGGLTSAIVFELAGQSGSEVLSFGVGTSIADLVAGIDLVSDATGVNAELSGTTLQLQSTAYGSSAFVDINIISEGSGSTPAGTFTTAVGQGQRDTGTDIVASVNGVSATGDGNDLSINTATLDLSATIDSSFTGTASFTITGGGALFQLGPDVVSNQQARLGIGSVNTAQLGGTTGLLFQLGTGGSADLSSDPNTAASIVEEAIDQVTSLRGRLGAFQRTTLETNKNALNDTLANLTEAESSIRDADFAAETAELTRSQILVQSGTRVLAIANQNPQNVLGLLG